MDGIDNKVLETLHILSLQIARMETSFEEREKAIAPVIEEIKKLTNSFVRHDEQIDALKKQFEEFKEIQAEANADKDKRLAVLEAFKNRLYGAIIGTGLVAGMTGGGIAGGISLLFGG